MRWAYYRPARESSHISCVYDRSPRRWRSSTRTRSAACGRTSRRAPPAPRPAVAALAPGLSPRYRHTATGWRSCPRPSCRRRRRRPLRRLAEPPRTPRRSRRCVAPTPCAAWAAASCCEPAPSRAWCHGIAKLEVRCSPLRERVHKPAQCWHSLSVRSTSRCMFCNISLCNHSHRALLSGGHMRSSTGHFALNALACLLQSLTSWLAAIFSSWWSHLLHFFGGFSHSPRGSAPPAAA